MYKYIFFYLIMLASQNFYCQDSTHINIIDSIGLKQGYWLSYHPNKIIQSIVYYRDGSISGVYYSFYNNGVVQSIIEFNEGIHDGEYHLFYKTGVKKSFAIYNKGNREYFAQYDGAGSIYYEEIYEKGVHVLTKHYTENGIIEGVPAPPSLRQP